MDSAVNGQAQGSPRDPGHAPVPTPPGSNREGQAPPPDTNGTNGGEREKSPALLLLSSERPRNVNWFQAGSLLFGDWGTSRLYVLGLAFLVAGRSAFWLIAAMSLLILAVSWAYTHVCRLYPDGGGVYTAGRRRAAILGVIGAPIRAFGYSSGA